MPTYKVKYDVVMGPDKGTVREDEHILANDRHVIAMALANEGEDQLIDVTNVETGEVIFPQPQPGIRP
jgi:hypothetical protein